MLIGIYSCLYFRFCILKFLINFQIAGKNEKNKRAYSVDVNEFDLVMQTTKAGTHDSESCQRQQSCLPLGGYRVVSCLHSRQLVLHQDSPSLSY
ncbi:hypothetical protein IFM89_015664 [Coptis chinensis]|uniref:Uncharacterized protein n=1 Tax=Coptis chinensis TaxID=261450 RepID=A0A835M512_9MAGN|nr:hypothetical protein IFM89_015664 [Coptis chinensis]